MLKYTCVNALNSVFSCASFENITQQLQKDKKLKCTCNGKIVSI